MTKEPSMYFQFNGKTYGIAYEGGPLCEFDEVGSPIRIVTGNEAMQVREAMEETNGNSV